MPFKTWVVGEEVLAADFNAMVQTQVVATFPNAAARSAALSAPQTGMLTYLADMGTYQRWTGTAWAFLMEVQAPVGNNSYPARLRTGTIVSTTDAAGNIATNVGPLGALSSIIVTPGDIQVPMIIMPYRSQFTVGATVVTWKVINPANGAAYASTVARFDFLIVET